MRRRVVVEGDASASPDDSAGAVFDARFECPAGVDEAVCPAAWREGDLEQHHAERGRDEDDNVEGEGPGLLGAEIKTFVVTNRSSDLVVKVSDRSVARQFGECVIFAFLPEDHFSSRLAPLVTGAARAFPHVVFVGIQGRQSGIAPGTSLPKAFPVLMHLAEDGKVSLYSGEHDDLFAVLKFVQDHTSESPVTWDPPTYSAMDDLLAAPPSNQRPLIEDGYFLLCCLFLVAFVARRLWR